MKAIRVLGTMLMFSACETDPLDPATVETNPVKVSDTILNDTVCNLVNGNDGVLRDVCYKIGEAPRRVIEQTCYAVPEWGIGITDVVVEIPNLMDDSPTVGNGKPPMDQIVYQQWFGLTERRWQRGHWFRNGKHLGSVSIDPVGTDQWTLNSTLHQTVERDRSAAVFAHEISDGITTYQTDCKNRLIQLGGSNPWAACNDCKWSKLKAMSAYALGAGFVVNGLASRPDFQGVALIIFTPLGFMMEAVLAELCDEVCAGAQCDYNLNICEIVANRNVLAQKRDQALAECIEDHMTCHAQIRKNKFNRIFGMGKQQALTTKGD